MSFRERILIEKTCFLVMSDYFYGNQYLLSSVGWECGIGRVVNVSIILEEIEIIIVVRRNYFQRKECYVKRKKHLLSSLLLSFCLHNNMPFNFFEPKPLEEYDHPHGRRRRYWRE